jgi:putative mRNA 3-end processing factor
MGLITFTDSGLYCKQGDFYIDPWKPVNRAVITHAHSDHARWGSNSYFAHTDSYSILKHRLGQDIVVETSEYGGGFSSNGVNVTLYPAGHIVGSAQVAIEYQGETWVVSGDYKTQYDGISPAFEPVKCNTFITESTFGLPIYQWQPQEEVMQEIHEWVLRNQEQDRYSVLSAYSLGKAQRLIHNLSAFGHKFYVHGAIFNMHEVVKKIFPLPDVTYLNAETPKEEVKKGIIIATGSAIDSPWMKRWQPYVLGVCSGWMQVRGHQRRRNADAGFVLSDHADWQGLLDAILATEADCVYATHGFSAQLARYLKEQYNIKADVVKTAFGEDEEE